MTDFELKIDRLKLIPRHNNSFDDRIIEWAISELEEFARVRLALASICPRLVHPETEQKESES